MSALGCQRLSGVDSRGADSRQSVQKKGMNHITTQKKQSQVEHNTECLSRLLEPKNRKAGTVPDREESINQSVLVKRSLERLQQVCFFVHPSFVMGFLRFCNFSFFFFFF